MKYKTFAVVAPIVAVPVALLAFSIVTFVFKNINSAAEEEKEESHQIPASLIANRHYFGVKQ